MPDNSKTDGIQERRSEARFKPDVWDDLDGVVDKAFDALTPREEIYFGPLEEPLSSTSVALHVML